MALHCISLRNDSNPSYFQVILITYGKGVHPYFLAGPFKVVENFAGQSEFAIPSYLFAI